MRDVWLLVDHACHTGIDGLAAHRLENVMTAATPLSTIRHLTMAEARAELARLIEQTGMTREELHERADNWDLDATERGLLSDIRSLEFLIERAASGA